VFIYHFNRLIHNRLLWIIFAVVVAFAFLSVDSCSSNLKDSNRTAGKLGGKTVDAERFAFAERFVSGSRNRAADIPPALVETQTWRHLAALHTAGAMGLGSTADEIRQAIREVPAFANQGQFDARIYRQAIAQSLGVAPATYERLMADQIVLAKLTQTVGSAGLVSAMELDDEVAAWTDLFTIQYATISNRFAAADLAVSDDDLRTFYAENQAAFALPDRVGVHYASLPVSNFCASVTIPEDDIAEFYDNNASRFTRSTTNDTLVTRALAEVRDEIVAELTLDEARYVAGTNAAAFMETLSMDGFNQFAWRARARQMQVATTPLFAEDGFVPGIEPEAEEEFRNAAFDLDATRLDARYAVVPGKEKVYLLMAWTNSPAYTPAFADIRRRIEPLALNQARAKAFKRLCDEQRSSLQAALTKGSTFPAAAAAQTLNVSTALTFAVQSASRMDLPNAQTVIPATMRLRKGELSEPVSIGDDELVIYVVDRKPGDAISSEMVRTQIREGLVRRRESAVIADWMQWNLETIGFSSARAVLLTDGDEPATADEE
jgi:parvulin-like peptidyl-prolyl isomerase